MPFDPQKRTLAQTRRLIAAMDTAASASMPPAGSNLPCWTGLSGRFLGDIGVNFDTPRNRQAEIGFAFAPAARGQGYASEAVGAMVDLSVRARPPPA